MGNHVYRSDAAAKEAGTKYSELLRHWPVEKEERDIDTPQGRTRVLVCGNPENPPLVLLHPGRTNSIHWLRQVQSYVATHRVFAIDIPGEAGHSEAVRLNRRDGSYANWLAAVLDQLNVHNTALLGASMGAWVCLGFACRWPERVDHLALVSPPGIVRRRRSRSKLLSAASLLLGPWGSRLILRGQLRRSGMEERVQELIAFAHANMKRQPRLPRFSLRQLAQLHCPVMLIVGGKDAYQNPDKVVLRMVRACPQVEVIYRPKEGHYPGEFTREVNRFLVSHFALD